VTDYDDAFRFLSSTPPPSIFTRPPSPPPGDRSSTVGNNLQAHARPEPSTIHPAATRVSPKERTSRKRQASPDSSTEWQNAGVTSPLKRMKSNSASSSETIGSGPSPTREPKSALPSGGANCATSGPKGPALAKFSPPAWLSFAPPYDWPKGLNEMCCELDTLIQETNIEMAPPAGKGPAADNRRTATVVDTTEDPTSGWYRATYGTGPDEVPGMTPEQQVPQLNRSGHR